MIESVLKFKKKQKILFRKTCGHWNVKSRLYYTYTLYFFFSTQTHMFSKGMFMLKQNRFENKMQNFIELSWKTSKTRVCQSLD